MHAFDDFLHLVSNLMCEEIFIKSLKKIILIKYGLVEFTRRVITFLNIKFGCGKEKKQVQKRVLKKNLGTSLRHYCLTRVAT